MKTIILGGFLGKKYGRIHEFDVVNPAEAIRALIVNFEDFASDLKASEQHGIGYKVFTDNALMPQIEEIRNPVSKTIRISPVITGSKSGFLGIVLGGLLIAASIFMPVLGATVLFGTAGAAGAVTLGGLATNIGASLLLGGVVGLLSPQQETPKPREAPQNTPSYVFDGPVNTTRQGQCVGVGYGEMTVGSAVVSAGIYSSYLKEV
jgi:predicted phage tail protein